MSDDEIWSLTRGGHDPQQGLRRLRRGGRRTRASRPCILAKTVKGYGMGEAGEGQIIAHQAEEDGAGRAARSSATASSMPVPDEQLQGRPVPQLGRRQPGDEVPARAPRGARRLPAAAPAQVARRCRSRRSRPSSALLKSTDGREISTTMAFVQILDTLLRDKQIGKRIVPIVPDESRTFGMEGMFRQFGIFARSASSTSRRTPTS